MAVEAVRTIFEVNILGVWAVTPAFLLPLLAARGVILNLCSANQAAVEALGNTAWNVPLGVRVVMGSLLYIVKAVDGSEGFPEVGAVVGDYMKGVADDLLREHPRAVFWWGGLATLAWVLRVGDDDVLLDASKNSYMIKANQLDKLPLPFLGSQRSSAQALEKTVGTTSDTSRVIGSSMSKKWHDLKTEEILPSPEGETKNIQYMVKAGP
ncbi:hypothetical protein K438DRAFT_1974857 [Mycena galopus ATCC 62051]|nr:hypothetical protein K438DRAFT_1974857 [Mycena galopus ATCC 62051]